MYRKECVMNVEKNKIKENQIPNILEQSEDLSASQQV
jgi:hypothetical protein